MHVAFTNHSALGDEVFQPYGNFAVRWVNQVYKITLPNGREVVNPNGVDQKTQLQGFNSRDAGERNAFMYEWSVCYYFIAQANTILKAINNPELTFSGDAETKKQTLRAWALWWKGWAYARIGSMYIAGLIVESAGATNPNYVTRDKVVEEAFKNLDECVTILCTLSNNTDYHAIMKGIIPSFNDNQALVTPDMWKRQINSFKARTILANKKVAAMTAADWNAVSALAEQGLKASDNYFKFGMDPNAENDVSVGWMHPTAFIGDFVQYTFVSERLIQEFKPGDARLEKGFIQYKDMNPPQPVAVNLRGRGLQFGTRYNPVLIEEGGLYATNDNRNGFVPFACSYEENELMRAEAKIYLGDIEGGLQLIDNVRAYQKANLAPVAGKGLTKVQALEELRRERRVALFLKGTAFYDARRWGIIQSKAQGGGRAGGIVLVPGNLLGTNSAFEAVPCFLDYSYMEYWDVPQNELDFNAPAPRAAPVKS
ncbi:MAG: RagB/SusD family nutrient uptake outer membrane protein [Flavisolibacter sp.]|nr:RagB/SusD family nutrient uptake outer membrane protein [Flavisolibacter sp.]